jgi:hypothetical protein
VISGISGVAAYPATPPRPQTPCNAASSAPPARSSTEATRSSSDSTAGPTHPFCAKPTSPPPKSPGGAAADSATNTDDQTGVESAARESALTGSHSWDATAGHISRTKKTNWETDSERPTAQVLTLAEPLAVPVQGLRESSTTANLAEAIALALFHIHHVTLVGLRLARLGRGRAHAAG